MVVLGKLSETEEEERAMWAERRAKIEAMAITLREEVSFYTHNNPDRHTMEFDYVFRMNAAIAITTRIK